MNKRKLKTACIAALSATMLLTGCGKLNGNADLMTIKNGDKTETISLGYANFAARYQQSMYDQYLLSYYGEDMWKQDMTGNGQTLQEETKDGVLDDIKEQYLAKAHAADYGVSITDEQTKAIDEAAEKFISDNSEESLEAIGATKDIVKEYLENRTYYKLVADAAKKELDKDITDDDCWMRSFTYVVFETTGKTDEDGNSKELTDDELAELKLNAKTLSQAEDFDAEVKALELTPSTFSYLKGEEEDSSMDMSIIEAAEKLKEGEVSSVITVDGAGLYVIRLDSDHDKDASDNKRESLQSEKFEELMNSWKDEIEWTVDEKAWADVKFNSLFKAVEKEEESKEETTEESTEESTEETTEESSEETTEEDSTESKESEETESN